MPDTFPTDLLPNQRALDLNCHMEQLHPRCRASCVSLLSFSRQRRVTPPGQSTPSDLHRSTEARQALDMGMAQDSSNFVYFHPGGSGLPNSPAATSAQYWTHITISSYAEPLQGRKKSYSSVFILSAQSRSGGTFGNTYQKLKTGLFYDQITLYLLWAVQSILTEINNIALFSIFISLVLYSAIG